MMTSKGGRRGPAARVERATASVSDATDTDATDWRADAEDAVLHLAALGVPFGADDVRTLGVGEPDRPNRWGAVFSALHAAGYLAPTGYQTSGRRPRNHGVQGLWVGTGAPPPASTRDPLDVRAALVADRRRAVGARVAKLAAGLDSATLPALACVVAALEDLDESLDALDAAGVTR